MSQLLKFGVILSLICLLATLVLAVTYEVTKPKIEEKERIEEEIALEAIMPEADSFKKKAVDEIDYFEALKGGFLVGYCIRATGNGYSGFIKIIVGIDLNGVIKGVEVLEHQETPGLGAKIREIAPGEKEPWFLKQLKGRLIKTPAAKKADAVTGATKPIDMITGATISSKAVLDAIYKTVNEFLSKVKR